MTRTGPFAVALVLGLTACAHDMRTMGTASPGADPKNPNAWVSAGKISVDPDVKRFAKKDRDFRITWTLESPGYRFPRNGIEFVTNPGGEIVDCHVHPNAERFSCLNVHGKPGAYKYTIRVEDLQGKQLEPLDPFILND